MREKIDFLQGKEKSICGGLIKFSEGIFHKKHVQKSKIKTFINANTLPKVLCQFPFPAIWEFAINKIDETKNLDLSLIKLEFQK